jgi:hypothetical protein
MTLVTQNEPIRRGKYKVRHDKQGKENRTVDGILFDSAKEAQRFWELRILQSSGQIKGLICDKNLLTFALEVNGVHICKYEADFAYRKMDDPDRVIVEDVKGLRTREFKIKKRLMKAVRGIDVVEI